MLKLIQILSISCFLFIACSIPSTQQSTQVNSAKFATVDSLLEAYVDSGRIVGGVALLAKDGEVRYQKAFGQADREMEIPMQEDAIFRIASMTKAITVIATMMLYEEGHFQLEDPIAKYIPEFSEMQVMIPDTANDSYTLETARNPITIRHLLNHTSGLTYRFWMQPHISDIYLENDIYNGLGMSEGNIGDMVKRLAKLPLVNHPGEGWNYGLNMDVLGYLVEIISEKQFDDFLEERLFTPLGMKDTYFYLPKEKESRLVQLYAGDNEGNINRITGESSDRIYADYSLHASNTEHFAGGGGLVSTAQDYFIFLQMILNKGSIHGQQIFKPETVELFTSEQVGDMFQWWPGYGFGFGFAISRGTEATTDPCGKGTFRWLGYLNTHFWADPENNVIGIYLTQTKVELGVEGFRDYAYRALEEN
jgi:CubicO group peptidase (beta-lactamase class C family)